MATTPLGDFFTHSGEDERRRKMVAFAMFAPARVVFSSAAATSPPPCAPHTEIEDEQAVVGGIDPASHGGRHSHVVVHHTGKGDTHLDTKTDFCSSGYDFFIRSDGEIVVCSRWDEPVGRHAKGCNCAATGVMLTGCFGGCPQGNVDRPTERQECSLAHVLGQLGTPDEDGRIVPHRHCAYWNPCDNPAPTKTVCCGTNLTTDDAVLHWNAEGEAFVTRVRQKRRNLEHLGCCSPPCPQAAAEGETLETSGSLALDAWHSEAGTRISLFPLSPLTGVGFVAEARDREGALLARRWFRPCSSGVLAALDLDDDPGSALPREGFRRRRPLVAGVVAFLAFTGVLSAIWAINQSQGGDDRAPLTEGSTPPPVRCDPPVFEPQRLPWSQEVGPPTSRAWRRDGSFELTWVGPPLPWWDKAQEVSLIRRIRPERAEVVSATASVRGRQAEIMLVGDEGVGTIRAFWQEAEELCESYELNVSHGATIDETVALLPRV